MLTDDDRLDEIRERLADPIRSGFMRRLDQSDLSWCAAEIARLREELDRRPEITPEDALNFMRFKPVPARDSREGAVMHALRAHAAKAVRP